MNKKVKYTFGGTKQDISKAKHPFQYYFDGQHIRITATDSQSTGAITNERGTELVITLPSITISGEVNLPVLAVDNDVTLTRLLGSKDINILSNDIYLDDVTVTIITPPTRGTAVLLSNNRVRYTDTAGTDNGIDSFTYQIDDGLTQSIATVNITITEAIVTVDDSGSDSNVLLTDNFDGTFYYYDFRPCDRSYDIFTGKSLLKIDDTRIVSFFSPIGIRITAGVAGKTIPQSTSWTTNGVKYSSNCLPLDGVQTVF